MKYSQPTVLTLCFSARIRQRVIECIDKMDVIAIHLDKEPFNKISLATIREVGFDLIIFDDEFLKDNPVSKLRLILPETRLLAVLDGNGWAGKVEYEFGSTIRRDLKDIVTIYKSSECSAIEEVIHYLFSSLYKQEFGGKDLKQDK